MHLTVAHDFLPKRPSVHTSLIMDHFGIGFETGRHVIAEGLEIPVQPGDVVCFTGPSGSGKSSLMRALAEALATDWENASRAVPPLCKGGSGGVASPDVAVSARNQSAPVTLPAAAARPAEGQMTAPRDPPCPPLLRGGEPHAVLNIDTLDLGNRPLVDALGLPADESLQLLSTCGLGEAQLLLRTPAELSDGQRYRFRLAAAAARRPAWIVADEFTATLDRTLAKVIAFNIRRLSARSGIGFLLATTHTDILDDLQPTLHVRCRLNGPVEVTRASSPFSRDPEGSAVSRAHTAGLRRAARHAALPSGSRLNDRASSGAGAKKKRRSASPANSRSPPVPGRTGRISLGGITAATTSASCGS